MVCGQCRGREARGSLRDIPVCGPCGRSLEARLCRLGGDLPCNRVRWWPREAPALPVRVYEHRPDGTTRELRRVTE